MGDLLIRDIDDDLKRWIAGRSRANGRSLSAEAREVLRAAKVREMSGCAFVRELLALVDERDKGDDLVFEFPHSFSEPPDFG
jgi:plasmid stability protein